jgi:tetratricopeptide (TPR) repeat protein
MLDADLGDRQGAEAALAANRRFIQMAIKGLPPDSFGRSFLPEFLGYYGYGVSEGYGVFALPLASADYETVRKEARASAGRLEQLDAANPDQKFNKNRTLAGAYRTAALASYRLGDYASADAEMKKAIEHGRSIPIRTPNDKRDANSVLTLQAAIAARQERLGEAQRIIEPVLKFHRELYARKDNEDLSQRIDLAQALYVSALAAPGQKANQLTEAAALLDGLPSGLRQLRSTTRLRDSIAEEQKKRR